MIARKLSAASLVQSVLASHFRIGMPRTILSMGASFAIAGGLSAQLPPKAPNSSVITLTPQPGHFSEPGIAINPNNPHQVVAVYQDNAHAAYSFDAGRTWQIATGVESTSYRVSGDVSATYDNQGHAFICYIAFDKLGTYSYWATTGGEMESSFAARLTAARPGNRKTSPPPSSPTKLPTAKMFPGKTSRISLPTTVTGLLRATSI